MENGEVTSAHSPACSELLLNLWKETDEYSYICGQSPWAWLVCVTIGITEERKALCDPEVLLPRKIQISAAGKMNS